MANPTEKHLAGEDSVALMGLTAPRQATSNTIILQARQQELVSSMHAFTKRGFSEHQALQNCPLDTMCSQGLGQVTERRQADVTTAPAFGNNAHCQLGQYLPGQGISCTQVSRVCGVTAGVPGWQRDGQRCEPQPRVTIPL